EMTGDTPLRMPTPHDPPAGRRPGPSQAAPVDPPPRSPSGADGPPPGPPASSDAPSLQEAPRRRRRVRRWWAALAGLLVLAFVVGAAVVPLPYYLFKPGVVRDTGPLVAVTGTRTYP